MKDITAEQSVTFSNRTEDKLPPNHKCSTKSYTETTQKNYTLQRNLKDYCNSILIVIPVYSKSDTKVYSLHSFYSLVHRTPTLFLLICI